MQKLKVHTEAAMLTMDQILASNELTIAGTAAMPALAFFGYAVMTIRRLLFTTKTESATKNADNILHFRLILSDVERSLATLQFTAASSTTTSSSSTGAGGSRVPMQEGDGSLSLVYSESEAEEEGEHVAATATATAGTPPRVLPTTSHTFLTTTNTNTTNANQTHSAAIHQIIQNSTNTWLVKGEYYFNIIRLRNKFQDLFVTTNTTKYHHIPSLLRKPLLSVKPLHHHHLLSSSPRKSTQKYKVAFMQQQQQQPLVHWWTWLSSWYPHVISLSSHHNVGHYLFQGMRSCVDFTQSLYTLLFGSHEFRSITTQYRSLHQDLLLLECPEYEVSLANKLDTTRRMRQSYKCLAPHY